MEKCVPPIVNFRPRLARALLVDKPPKPERLNPPRAAQARLAVPLPGKWTAAPAARKPIMIEHDITKH